MQATDPRFGFKYYRANKKIRDYLFSNSVKEIICSFYGVVTNFS